MILKRLGYCVIVLLACLLAAPVQAEESDSTVSMDHTITVGYNGVTVDKDAARAREYDELRSSPLVNIDFMGNVGHQHMFIEGEYKGVNDYSVSGHVDLEGKLKLKLSSERLWHNLEHIDYDNRPDGITSLYDNDNDAGTPDAADTRATVAPEADPDTEYGLRLQFDEAEAIIKLGDNPAHVRLKYWRQTKQGKKQLRFLEEGHDLANGGSSCDSCHLQSKTRDIKRVTDELTASVDAHVGYVDLVFEQLVRFFTVKDPVPVDTFYGHYYFGPTSATDFQHDEDPESRLLQSTVMARTSLAGGFVADAAYTYGFRENRNELSRVTTGAGSVNGVDGVDAAATYQKLAGNISYMPRSDLTLNLRYRMLDVDTRNSDQLTTGDSLPAYTPFGPPPQPTYPALSPVEYPVRDNMDIQRIKVAGSASWRPSRKLTFKGEAQREIIVRGNTGIDESHHGTTAPIARTGSIDHYWELPEKEIIDQFRISLTSRPFGYQSLKLNTWYRYAHSSDPAYGTSYENRHEGFGGANYTSKAYWGITAAARTLRDDNDEVEHEGALYKRVRNQFNGDFGVWLTPASRLTTGINYGYLNSRIHQEVLFGANSALIPPNRSKYLMQSHNVSMHATLQLLETVSLRADGYYLQSKSTFNPQYMNITFTNGLVATTDDLTETSKIDIRQQGVSAGIDWKPTNEWSVGLKYSVDNYHAQNTYTFAGTAQTAAATLSRTW